MTDFYVDDLITGAETMEEAVKLYQEMNELMLSGGFQMQKWCSNNQSFMSQAQKENSSEKSIITFQDNSVMKVLGVAWNRETDNFEYRVVPIKDDKVTTKREVLSEIARLYDPLGWIAPVTLRAKVFMQTLWKAEIGWDEELNDDLLEEWRTFRGELSQLAEVRIPRWIGARRSSKIELHAFADASRVAYAGVVYLKVTQEDGQIAVSIIAAKTKVAPIVRELTIPRLELCGALLAAKLLNETAQILGVSRKDLYAWTDSTVVLAWLKGPASKWSTYVSNRVSQISNILEYEQWRHVNTKENPADCASRGLDASDLQEHELWWKGPKFLQHPAEQMEPMEIPDTRQEERITTCIATNIDKGPRGDEEIFWRYSTKAKLTRVISFCFRFVDKCKGKKVNQSTGPLTTTELQRAINALTRLSQIQAFPQDYKQLSRDGRVSERSSILALNPFMDKEKIIRVGGRLRNSELKFEKRHPKLISEKHKWTELIVRETHEKLLHCGVQQLLATVREQFWPTGGRKICKRIVNSCVECFKSKPKFHQYIMGDLPRERAVVGFPFENVGVDYAGPVSIKDSKLRNARYVKGYIVLFICLSTKAIHLDLVTELTTDAFIRVLRRFIARRGRPKKIFSDNGTNFLGAANKLKTSFKEMNAEKIENKLSEEGIQWHFNPPRAPAFGGLWEANIKRVKHHLARTLGNSKCTYEEFQTILIQIESILNSRPLCPMSDDPEDMSPLTPAHFLIGRTFTTIPETKETTAVPANIRDQQKLIREFWNRWNNEYVNHLQRRTKWKTESKVNLQIGTLVLFKDDTNEMGNWRMGRIVEVHPGADGVIRVATVKTADGRLFRRSSNRLCPLPTRPD